MSPRSWIAAAVVIVAASTSARAETKNEVRAVSFTETGDGITRVHVRGVQTPTFTVYKLERPSRVVIDMPQARLSDALRGHESAAMFSPNTWAVSAIAAQQLDDGAVRVIVTLARPGRYDVKTDGNEVVVMVMPRDVAPKTTSPAELEAAKQQAKAADEARVVAEKSSEVAKAEAERLRKAAADQLARAEAAQKAVEAAKQAAAKNAASAADLAKAKQLAQQAKDEAEEARKVAQLAQIEADKRRNAAELARRDALAEAAAAKAEAEKARLAVAQMKDEATKAKDEATKAKNEATKAQAQATKAQAEASRAQAEASMAQSSAKQDLAKAKAEIEAAKRDAAKAKAEAEQMAKLEVEAAKREAAAAKAEAEKTKAVAAKQLQTMEQKTLAAQQIEDKARTALAAAQAREEAAQAIAAQARQERLAAEAAAKKAQQARDSAAATDRSKLVAEAKAAEERLLKARRATEEADAKRIAAEQLATSAKMDLETSKSALATVEQQRVAAQAAATEAARKRAEAEAAATDASKRRMAAETAAQQAESSLADLTKKRQAAERAADELTKRTKAEAKAQAEVAAAKARKAGDDELAAVRKEVAKLTEERKRAESDLADRRKAVAQQQSEVAKLEATAVAARAQLAQQREQEERDIAKLKAQKVQAQVQAQVAQTQTRSTPPPQPATPTPAPAPAPTKVATVAAKVSGVTFKGNEASGTVELTMAGDASVQLGEVSATHVELIVDGAELAQKLERTLDVSKFGSPVKKVSTFSDRRAANRVKLVAELASPAIPTVVRSGNTVRWRFASSGTTAHKTTNIPPTVVGGFGAASTPVAQQTVSQVPGAGKRRTYYGATVEFDFKDAPIHDLLRIIADTGGVNIVVPDTIDAKVTVRLKRVPWDQALDVILKSHALGFRREGNLYRIAPQKELDAEDEAEAARRAAAVQAEAPKPEVVILNYSNAAELRGKLESMLSPKGKIEVDDRTNSLIINDVAANRESIARLALGLDIQTPQITIEARIVEARSTFVRQFGIQWGGRALASSAGGNATGLIFPSSVGVRGANSDNQTNDNGISALPSDFAINLPAATGSGEGGAIGMSLGSVGGNFNINLRLSALEDTGTVRIISAPKITVMNNKPALIRQGVSIPIAVVSAAGTNTQFVQADLKLEVTPYVSQRDCAIAMNLDVTKNEPDFVNVGARGDPSILRKEAKTTMLVADGETTVLGGIYTRNSGLAYKKVPFFADLPVIGWFFKNRRENDDRTEILVFITPKITNRASLRCVQ